MLPHQRRAEFLTYFGVGLSAASITVVALMPVWGVVNVLTYGLDDPPPGWMVGGRVGIGIAAIGAWVVAGLVARRLLLPSDQKARQR